MPENSLELDPNPSPSGESEEFSTADEKKAIRENSHQLEILRQEQGPIGKLIGCSDSALTIAFSLLVLGGVAILGTGIGLAVNPSAFAGIMEKLITFELTIAGYVMGKHSI